MIGSEHGAPADRLVILGATRRRRPPGRFAPVTAPLTTPATSAKGWSATCRFGAASALYDGALDESPARVCENVEVTTAATGASTAS